MGTVSGSFASETELARREIVEQVDAAIHRLEGFDPDDAPHPVVP